MTRRLVWVLCLVPAFALMSVSDGSQRDTAIGEAIYRQHCAVCHGFNGVAVTPEVPSFGRGEGLNKPDRELLKVLENGKGQMPALKQILSKAEQRSVLAYVRSIPGRRVFEAQCVGCHNKVQFAQVLAARLPKLEDLEKKEGTIDVCRGTAVQKTISHREAAGILRYIQTFKEF